MSGVIGELAGMKAGAIRVADWLTRIWRGRKLPAVMPWNAHADSQGTDKGLIDPDVPLDGHGPIPALAAAKVC